MPNHPLTISPEARELATWISIHFARSTFTGIEGKIQLALNSNEATVREKVIKECAEICRLSLKGSLETTLIMENEILKLLTTPPTIKQKEVKLKYIGVGHPAQIIWGGNVDPDKEGLILGKTYTKHSEEVRSQHTKLFLVEFPGKQFNSLWFEEVK